MGIGRIFGLVLLATGVAMLVIGMIATDSFFEQASKNLTGQFTDGTNFYLISGVVGTVVGGILVLFGGSRADA